MKPVSKPRKTLSKTQIELMRIHKDSGKYNAHHMKNMTKMMKEGYCFQQAHELAVKEDKKKK